MMRSPGQPPNGRSRIARFPGLVLSFPHIRSLQRLQAWRESTLYSRAVPRSKEES
jgi:hypothetical protein